VLITLKAKLLDTSISFKITKLLTLLKIAIAHGLYEEALTIYKKYDQHALAINVLVEHIVSIDHGLEYATKVN
jgi:hypothetical protein